MHSNADDLACFNNLSGYPDVFFARFAVGAGMIVCDDVAGSGSNDCTTKDFTWMRE
jgi:hypothetical protein